MTCRLFRAPAFANVSAAPDAVHAGCLLEKELAYAGGVE